MKQRRWKTRLLHLYFLLRRPMTLGVRIVVTDAESRVLLVRHSYVAGWHLPGGGVERGETAMDAVYKELMEETGIEPLEEPELVGVLANRRASPRDHVFLYRCGDWHQKQVFTPNREVLEVGFYDPADLPEATTGPTRQRIEEVLQNKPVARLW